MQSRLFNTGLSFVLVVLFGIIACSARPPRGDNVYGDALQESGSIDATNNLVGPGDGHPANRLLQNPDDAALAALQMQLLQQYAAYNNMRSLPWDQLMRPQDKRQIRYRQCYFNPISCFRK